MFSNSPRSALYRRPSVVVKRQSSAWSNKLHRELRSREQINISPNLFAFPPICIYIESRARIFGRYCFHLGRNIYKINTNLRIFTQRTKHFLYKGEFERNRFALNTKAKYKIYGIEKLSMDRYSMRINIVKINLTFD